MADHNQLPGKESGDPPWTEALEQFWDQVDAGLDPDPQEFLNGQKEPGDLAACLEGLAAMEELRAALKAEDDEPSLTPRTQGDYQIVREVGRGGMGVVYEAQDPRLGRRVALKMIKAGDLAGPEDVLRFQAEARAIANLQHPGIVQIYEVGEHDGRPFLALEFVDGISLETRISQAPLPPTFAAGLVQTLAHAIHYAHTQQIVHRDLKPANILLSLNRVPPESPGSALSGGTRFNDIAHPKVTDFGLAKRLDGAGQTHTGAVLGTPSYMAPEQATGNSAAIGPATDVYALGAILYEAITGRPPFKAATALETLDQVKRTEPVSPRRLQPQTPLDLETICLKCLHKEPERRYATAHDLAEDLGRLLRGEPILARPVGPVGWLKLWCRRNPVVASLMGAAGVLAFMVIGLGLLRLTDAAANREKIRQRRAEILHGNVYYAQGVASRVLLELQHLASAVAETAEDPVLRDLLRKPVNQELQTYFERVYVKYQERGFVGPGGRSAFHSWHVLDQQAILRADAPEFRFKVVGKEFPHRDYREGALAHEGETGLAAIHVSRVYQSENDSLYKITLSARVRAGQDSQAPTLGVVSATMPASSTLGSLRLANQNLKAVLVGRRDPKPPRGEVPDAMPTQYLIIIHPAYDAQARAEGNRAVPVPVERLRSIPQPRPGSEFQLPPVLHDFKDEEAMNPAYEDPLAETDPDYGGRWLAGFAPVGNTELLVIVQQRDDAPADVSGSLGDWLILLALVMLTVAVLGGFLVWRRGRRIHGIGVSPPSLESSNATTLTH